MNTASLEVVSRWAGVDPYLIVLILIWSLAWKGVALWRSAGLRHKYWFISILIVNTLGILEMIYLFFVARNYRVELVEEK
jgi:hypothetical protein